MKRQLRVDNSNFQVKLNQKAQNRTPRKTTYRYVLIYTLSNMYAEGNVNGPSNILRQSFFVRIEKKIALREKMSEKLAKFVIEECVTARAIHVLRILECACRSDGNKEKRKAVSWFGCYRCFYTRCYWESELVCSGFGSISVAGKQRCTKIIVLSLKKSQI